MKISFEKANDVLVAAFPEMKEIYDKEYEEYFDLEYSFYESEFQKFIMEQIRSKDTVQLKKIFDFVEDLFENGDDGIVNLVGVAVVESTYFEEDFDDIKDLIFEYCGPKTKASFDDSINWTPDDNEESQPAA